MTWTDNHNPERYFTKDGVYRVKGRLTDRQHPKNTYNEGSIYLTEIISGNEKNDFLENLFTEYNKEVSINSEVFGKMIMNKAFELYNAQIYWHDIPVVFMMFSRENENAENTLSLMEDFYKNLDYWDKKSREYISENITELTEMEITPEFLENLIMADVYFWADGRFTVTYEDYSEIVGDNIIVAGDIRTGIKRTYTQN